MWYAVHSRFRPPANTIFISSAAAHVLLTTTSLHSSPFHTATSVPTSSAIGRSPSRVSSSVSGATHRLLDRIVPMFFWLLLRFTASLYSMYGVPVSIWDFRIASHRV